MMSEGDVTTLLSPTVTPSELMAIQYWHVKLKLMHLGHSV